MICIATLTTGRWKQNCFVVSNRNGTAVVIDPGEDAEHILSYIKQESLNVAGVINTHGHYDHVGSVVEIREHFGTKFYMHSGDKKLLSQANFYQHIFGGTRRIQIPEIDIDLAESDIAQIEDFKFLVAHSPGHTEGSVSLSLDGFLFTGDLVLFGKMGRSDLPGGNEEKLKNSVETILNLPETTHVFPGHGPPVSLKDLKTSISSPKKAT